METKTVKPKKAKPLTEKQKEVLAKKKARQDAINEKLRIKKEREDAKLKKVADRLKKKAELETKKNAIAWKKEQRELKKTVLIDSHTVNDMISKGAKAHSGLPKYYRLFTKDEVISILVINPENKFQAVVSINCVNDWRHGYWFFDAQTKKYLKFEKEVHKPGYGDDAILWSMFNENMEKQA